jgi:subtilisin family serine protease
MTTPTDPLYGSQWHFPLIGDIETIWDEYDGSGVHVGVYDDGVEYTHPDLSGNYDPSLHFSYGGTTYDPAPIATDDGHGTSVAGLIAATDNNDIGGTGVASGASITGVNFLGDIQFQSFTILLASLDYAQNFDIMNNSWGRTPLYASNQSLTNPTSSRYLYNEEYQDVVEAGRGGLGTVILQAAGNDDLNANGMLRGSLQQLPQRMPAAMSCPIQTGAHPFWLLLLQRPGPPTFREPEAITLPLEPWVTIPAILVELQLQHP